MIIRYFAHSGTWLRSASLKRFGVSALLDTHVHTEVRVFLPQNSDIERRDMQKESLAPWQIQVALYESDPRDSVVLSGTVA